jgi:hypothetical protein
MSQPYIFISERCPHSKQIVETLKGLNKIGLYRIVNVESLTRPQLAGLPFLQKVPTLYHPETKDVVVGKDIFGYISKPTNSRKELPAKQGGAGQPQLPTGDLSAWGFERSGILSESYSSWDAPTSFVSDGNSMYTFLGPGSPNTGGADMPGVAAPVAENTLKSKTGANNDIAGRMEAIQKQRENEFSGVQRK